MAPLFPLLRHSIRSHFRLYGFRNGDIAEYWHSPPPSSAGTSYCDGGRIDKVEETCHVGDCTKKWQWEIITGFVLATIFIRGSCEMRLLTTFTHMERITEEQLTHWVLSETFRKHFTIADEAIVFRRGLSEDAVVFWVWGYPSTVSRRSWIYFNSKASWTRAKRSGIAMA